MNPAAVRALDRVKRAESELRAAKDQLRPHRIAWAQANGLYGLSDEKFRAQIEQHSRGSSPRGRGGGAPSSLRLAPPPHPVRKEA